ncbi:kinesin-like nuclear fusion protein [Conoideocrella luteorostrata]|uniref:Kinesin-like protein n=1 Tax=Conoideocrella luteorostrata TaxID=1105319 RepID=A0AAJ0CPG3_9HYPO|nr:kinesin-like nuclear fusion protein [Conoideocrella luteorostrata]
METSDIQLQPLRASRISRLPGPPAHPGLTELTDSQHNARAQSSIPAPPGMKASLKREIPQPGAIAAAHQPDPKRKNLVDRAAEYSAPPTVSSANTSKLGVKGQTLAQLKKLGHTTNAPAASISSFAKSIGPGKHQSDRSHPPLARSSHARSRSQVARPRTAHGNRPEEHFDDESTSNSGTKPTSNESLHCTKIRHMKSTPSLFRSRDSSLTSKFKSLNIHDHAPNHDVCRVASEKLSNTALSPLDLSAVPYVTAAPPKTPSNTQMKKHMARMEECISALKTPSSISKSPSPHKFLRKDSNLAGFTAWDVDRRVGSVESQFYELKDIVNSSLKEQNWQKDALENAQARVQELEAARQKLEKQNEVLTKDLGVTKDKERHVRLELEKAQWQNTREVEDMNRRHQETQEGLLRQHRTEMEDLSRDLYQLKDEDAKEHQARQDGLTRHYQQELADERQKHHQEIQDLRARMGGEQHDLSLELQRKDREIRDSRLECDRLRDDVERERQLKNSLQTNITELSASNITLEAKINSLRSQVEFLESDSKAQSDSFFSMETRLQEALAAAEEARQKLIKEETERRVLFNKYQELKGNIRVMCRVRPSLTGDSSDPAGILFPDEKTSAEIVLAGPMERSSLGVVSRKNHPFEFDRVFAPAVQNEEIFGEISQLVQSALDGYNVCIFCYGQTGSGKTFTMSSEDGMIPRATHMIYDTMTKLKEKSWEYTMEGSFVEVYNEELNDLLTPNDRCGEARAKKLEIRHDESLKQTTIANCKTVQLNSASSVEKILEEAQKNRSVAATKANERSSRSHSVFILKLVGENMATGERCEGTLNLVDLAGSERLKHSQAEGDRMKETQNINKSLSCLGDVIEALGKGSGHIPYRNSKLTHLLQYSLGGNSKTLMFVMVSPLEVHLKETLTSLRFATKVHNTHIGTAKASKKIKGSD